MDKGVSEDEEKDAQCSAGASDGFQHAPAWAFAEDQPAAGTGQSVTMRASRRVTPRRQR